MCVVNVVTAMETLWKDAPFLASFIDTIKFLQSDFLLLFAIAMQARTSPLRKTDIVLTLRLGIDFDFYNRFDPNSQGPDWI